MTRNPAALTILALAIAGLAACGSGSGGSALGITNVTGPPPDEGLSTGVAVADFDGDGVPDIAVAEVLLDGPPPHQSVITLLASNSNSVLSFTAVDTLTTPWDVGEIEIGDLDNDGRPDLVLRKENLHADDGVGALMIFLNESQPGEIRFAGGRETIDGTPLSDLVVADVNGDGLDDVVTVGAETRILLNSGGKIEPPGADGIVGVGGSAITAGDLDGDVDTDLVIASAATGFVRIFLQEGGAFLLSDELNAGDQPTDIHIADLDDDARPDIVVGNLGKPEDTSTASVSIFRQAAAPAASGQFDVAVGYGTPRFLTTLVVADLDGDNRPDIASGHNESVLGGNEIRIESGLQVLLQQADGSFGAAATYDAAGQANGLIAADVNDDSLIDLVMSSNGARVFLNSAASPGVMLAPQRIGP